MEPTHGTPLRTPPCTPRRDQGHQRFAAGCIGCEGKTSPRFRRLKWSAMGILQLHGIRLMFGEHATEPWACTACYTRWSKLGVFKPTLGVDKQEVQDDVPSFVLLSSDDAGSESSGDFVVRPLHNSVQAPITNNENSPDYATGLDLLIQHPFNGAPFDDPFTFIDHLENICGKIFTAKSEYFAMQS